MSAPPFLSASTSHVALLGLLVGCSADPMHDDRVDALGPEAPGVSPGPLHRPGQPCVLCHGGKGPGDDVFSFAGTVFKQPDSLEPLPDAIVRFVDSERHHYVTATNCAGNFFVHPADFDPTSPVWVSVVFGGIPIEMSSPIFRSGSCADCHGDPPSASSVGHVYFAPGPVAFPPSSCP